MEKSLKNYVFFVTSKIKLRRHHMILITAPPIKIIVYAIIVYVNLVVL